MNKILKNLYLILVFSLAISNIYCVKLTEAINKLDVKEVEHLLAEKSSFTQYYKTKLLSVIKKNIKVHKTIILNLSKIKDPKSSRHLRKIIAGSLSVLTGSILAFFGFDSLKYGLSKKKSDPSSDWSLDIKVGIGINVLASGFFAGGIKQIYTGWKLRSAFLNLQKAHEIKTLIQNCPVKNNQNI